MIVIVIDDVVMPQCVVRADRVMMIIDHRGKQAGRARHALPQGIDYVERGCFLFFCGGRGCSMQRAQT